MNIGKFLNKMTGRDKLDAYQQAAQYQQSAAAQGVPPAPGGPAQKDSRLTTDVTFEKTTCEVPFRLATSEWERTVSGWEEIEEALDQMLDGELEFVILTTGDASHGIRFIQTCPLPDQDMVTVELSLEEPGNSRARLVEKDCGQEEVFAIFRAFYQTGDVPNRERYQPVRFFQ